MATIKNMEPTKIPFTFLTERVINKLYLYNDPRAPYAKDALTAYQKYLDQGNLPIKRFYYNPVTKQITPRNN